jgi:hypothetical protein
MPPSQHSPEEWVFCRTTRSVTEALAVSAGNRDAEMGEVFLTNTRRSARSNLRNLVNAVKFVKALSRKGARNVVRNAGIHKATQNPSSPIASSFRPRHASSFKKEPPAGIPLRWGEVQQLEEHSIGATGTSHPGLNASVCSPT